jgi:hypothetical protein
MKKLFIFLILAIAPTIAFAYSYDSYGSNAWSSAEIIAALLSIVTLIVFFYLASNISKIKDYLIP